MVFIYYSLSSDNNLIVLSKKYISVSASFSVILETLLKIYSILNFNLKIEGRIKAKLIKIKNKAKTML
jgi:hypothetical protein